MNDVVLMVGGVCAKIVQSETCLICIRKVVKSTLMSQHVECFTGSCTPSC
jgi:hypothetical protein